ncbi:MAG: hypothetical protein HY326_01795 [Chloroflexi bacterium]|nr:hypothetical protein [Chloroflexota bacterium]
MPFEITFEMLPVGYILSPARAGEEVDFVSSEFTSSEDGDLFVSRLEGIPNDIISKLPPEKNFQPSIIDHLLAIIRKDKTATAYVNEVNTIMTFVSKRKVTKGEMVSTNDMADIEKVRFEGIEIPNDVGVVYVFSVGWRKAMFFDFGPINSNNPVNRQYDIERQLAQFHAYLLFQDFYKITEDEWGKLIDQQWFPFISLNVSTVKKILSYSKNGWNVDELLPKIREELVNEFDALVDKWKGIPFSIVHLPFLENAINRYIAEDYMSTIAILFPRIEGIMRSFFDELKFDEKATQTNLVGSVFFYKDEERNPFSLLLPRNFRRYLLEVYFAKFDPKGPKPLSRNTVSHGVADASDFSLKGATISFLILDQLFYYLRPHWNKAE